MKKDGLFTQIFQLYSVAFDILIDAFEYIDILIGLMQELFRLL